MTKIAFKSTLSNLETLFPTRILNRIPANHPVLIVNQVVDELDIRTFLVNYSARGASRYHPRMMLKVLFYAYLNNIYSHIELDKNRRINREPSSKNRFRLRGLERVNIEFTLVAIAHNI